MIRLGFGKHAGVYTKQSSFEYTKNLSLLWRFFGWTVALAFAGALAYMSYLWKKFGSGLVNDYNSTILFGAPLGDMGSTLALIALVVILFSFLLYTLLKFGIERTASSPSLVVGVVSFVMGTASLKPIGVSIYTSWALLSQLDTQRKFRQYYGIDFRGMNLERLYDLYILAATGWSVFLLVTWLFMLIASFFGLYSAVEAFRREPLPAKTLQPLKIKFFDNMRYTREKMREFAEDQLKANGVDEEAASAVGARVEANIKNHSPLILQEGDHVAGFVVRTKDFAELLELWIYPEFQGRQLGSFLLQDYITHAQKHGMETLYTEIPPEIPDSSEFLEANGWTRTSALGPLGGNIHVWKPLDEEDEALKGMKRFRWPLSGRRTQSETATADE